MFAPSEGEFAGGAVGYRVSFGSPELAALATALNSLVSASDGVADAVTRHDRLALVRSNEQADALVDEVNRLAESLTPQDREMLGEFGVPALCEQLAVGARRNAYLIEQAWAVDAALMRLLVGIGKVGPDGAVGGYGVQPGAAYLDRGA